MLAAICDMSRSNQDILFNVYSQRGGIRHISMYYRLGSDGVLFCMHVLSLRGEQGLGVVCELTDKSLTDNGLLGRLAGGELQLLGSELRLFGRVARW